MNASEVPQVKGVTTVNASTDAVWKHLSGGDSSSGVPSKLYSAGFVSKTYSILAKLRKAF